MGVRAAAGLRWLRGSVRVARGCEGCGAAPLGVQMSVQVGVQVGARACGSGPWLCHREGDCAGGAGECLRVGVGSVGGGETVGRGL